MNASAVRNAITAIDRDLAAALRCQEQALPFDLAMISLRLNQVCDAVTALPIAEGRTLRNDLEGLLGQLDGLEQAMHANPPGAFGRQIP